MCPFSSQPGHPPAAHQGGGIAHSTHSAINLGLHLAHKLQQGVFGCGGLHGLGCSKVESQRRRQRRHRPQRCLRGALQRQLHCWHAIEGLVGRPAASRGLPLQGRAQGCQRRAGCSCAQPGALPWRSQYRRKEAGLHRGQLHNFGCRLGSLAAPAVLQVLGRRWRKAHRVDGALPLSRCEAQVAAHRDGGDGWRIGERPFAASRAAPVSHCCTTLVFQSPCSALLELK